MSEDTIHIEVPILIPGLTHKEDGCLARLKSAFENKKGIFRAQVKNHQTPLLLELRYDPAQFNIETIRKIAPGRARTLPTVTITSRSRWKGWIVLIV